MSHGQNLIWNRSPSGDEGSLFAVEYGAAWEPVTDEAVDPITFGMEVFAHRRMPDGTRLNTEDRRYIAAVVMNNLRKGE